MDPKKINGSCPCQQRKRRKVRKKLARKRAKKKARFNVDRVTSRQGARVVVLVVVVLVVVVVVVVAAAAAAAALTVILTLTNIKSFFLPSGQATLRPSLGSTL